MFTEAGAVLDKNGLVIMHHVPNGRSAGGIPDSQHLWFILWENRHNLSGFAHSHPGDGFPEPSQTDLTTFVAIEAALGMRLDWWIISSNSVTLVHTGPNDNTYLTQHLWTDALPWVRPLRILSKMGEMGDSNA